MEHRRPYRNGSVNDADSVIKLLLLGDGAVGKSSLLLRYCEDKFDPRHILTIGVDFKSKVINVAHEKIRLQIWDTAGQERFRNITPVYFRSAMGVVLVFDVASMESFENVTYWLDSLENHASATLRKALVGNKIDISKRQVSRRRGEALAAKHGTAYFETSALQNIGVDELFLAMATMIRKQQIEALSNDLRDLKMAHFGRNRNFESPAFQLDGSGIPEASSGTEISCCGVSLKTNVSKKLDMSRSPTKTDDSSRTTHGSGGIQSPKTVEDSKRPSVVSANLEDPRSPGMKVGERRERLSRLKSKVDVSRDSFMRRAPRHNSGDATPAARGGLTQQALEKRVSMYVGRSPDTLDVTPVGLGKDFVWDEEQDDTRRDKISL